MHRISPKALLWAGIACIVIGTVLVVAIPGVVFVNELRPSDQPLLLVLDAIVRILREGLMPLGSALTAAGLVLAQLERRPPSAGG